MRKPSHYIGKPVESLQTMLRTISQIDSNTLPVIPNGLYGSSTYASVRSFQASHGLPLTGEADLQTWNRIIDVYRDAAPHLMPPIISIPWSPEQTILSGEANGHIYLVQAMLKALSEHFPALQPPILTGNLDSLTQKGLEWIQRASGLPPTGILNTATWHYLSELYTVSLGDGKK